MGLHALPDPRAKLGHWTYPRQPTRPACTFSQNCHLLGLIKMSLHSARCQCFQTYYSIELLASPNSASTNNVKPALGVIWGFSTFSCHTHSEELKQTHSNTLKPFGKKNKNTRSTQCKSKLPCMSVLWIPSNWEPLLPAARDVRMLLSHVNTCVLYRLPHTHCSFPLNNTSWSVP